MKKVIFTIQKSTKVSLCLLLSVVSLHLWSQVGVGTSNPDGSAVLEIQSITKGILLPRLTGLQMNSIASPAEGLMVYCTNCTPKGIYYYDGTSFLSTISENASGSEDGSFAEIFSTTGRVWMDRNLGATQAATSTTDHLAYGNLYQWGRASDGHEVINWISSSFSDGAEQSRETSTLSATDTPGNDDFILTSTNDWRSTNNNNLWQGVNGTNNPCPSGFKVPTLSEWSTEQQAFVSNNASGAFDALKLTTPGIRTRETGTLINEGSAGSYWSSTTNGTSGTVRLGISVALFNNFSGSSVRKAEGYSVRCIRD